MILLLSKFIEMSQTILVLFKSTEVAQIILLPLQSCACVFYDSVCVTVFCGRVRADVGIVKGRPAFILFIFFIYFLFYIFKIS